MEYRYFIQRSCLNAANLVHSIMDIPPLFRYPVCSSKEAEQCDYIENSQWKDYFRSTPTSNLITMADMRTTYSREIIELLHNSYRYKLSFSTAADYIAILAEQEQTILASVMDKPGAIPCRIHESIPPALPMSGRENQGHISHPPAPPPVPAPYRC